MNHTGTPQVRMFLEGCLSGVSMAEDGKKVKEVFVGISHFK